MIAPRCGLVLLGVLTRVSFAQDAGSSATVRVSASATPLITRATPTAARRSLTEAYLTQPMVNAGLIVKSAFLVTTLDLEGLTMERGELTTGMHGEGYVDRRHPHTYLHELMAGVSGSVRDLSLSLSAGKGFVPFGSDDPMLRPSVKYPINHHLAQILERAVVIGGARYRFALLELATFNGDEPTRPSSSPELSNFGDSWATRFIVGGEALQTSASYAFVRSPESAAGQALDQRKYHASIRWTPKLTSHRLTTMAEWARSLEDDPGGGTAFTFSSWLAEGKWRSGRASAALRLERTERPEEDRLNDPFRTARPAVDHSLLGITRWHVATLTASRDMSWRGVRTAPFVETSIAHPRSTTTSVFQPRSFYGSDRLWMVTLGARLAFGAAHEGMGYYGVRRQPTMTDHQHRH